MIAIALRGAMASVARSEDPVALEGRHKIARRPQLFAVGTSAAAEVREPHPGIERGFRREVAKTDTASSRCRRSACPDELHLADDVALIGRAGEPGSVGTPGEGRSDQVGQGVVDAAIAIPKTVTSS